MRHAYVINKSNSRNMTQVKVRFVISQLTEDEVEALKASHPIIAKMILSPDDYKLFNYNNGELIEVETQNGNRLWCTIRDMEIVDSEERVIIIFTLIDSGE